MLTVGSLFSGIGGLELGLERTSEFKTIWQCEIDEYASAVLKKHWPTVRNLGDITKVDWNGVEKPDLICGGFPCQDISVAGKGKGIREGERSGLWREYAKAIRALRPKYALIENVSILATRGLDVVLADLAENGEGVVPQVGQTTKDDINGKGREPRLNPLPENNASNYGRIRIQRRLEEPIREFPEFSWCKNVRRVENLRGRPDIPEPLFRGSRDGVPCWVQRIKCLGNSVVPACAQVIGEAIIEVEREKNEGDKNG